MVQSRMFSHCVKIYEYMDSQAFDDGDDRVFRGFLSKIIEMELGLSPGYYTPLKNILEEQGCILKRYRGGGKQPSEWILLFPPNEEAFNNRIFDPTRRRTTTQSQELVALARLSERLSRIEEIVELLLKEVFDADSELGRGEPLSEVQHSGNGS